MSTKNRLFSALPLKSLLLTPSGGGMVQVSVQVMLSSNLVKNVSSTSLVIIDFLPTEQYPDDRISVNSLSNGLSAAIWSQSPAASNTVLTVTPTRVALRFTRQRFLMNTVTLVYTVIMHVECGRTVFWQASNSNFSTMRCRKCNFVLLDIKVGLFPRLLLTFLAGMKAKDQKCVIRFWASFWVFTREQFHQDLHVQIYYVLLSYKICKSCWSSHFR